MTVGELRKALIGIDDDTEVFIYDGELFWKQTNQAVLGKLTPEDSDWRCREESKEKDAICAFLID